MNNFIYKMNKKRAQESGVIGDTFSDELSHMDNLLGNKDFGYSEPVGILREETNDRELHIRAGFYP